MDAVVEGVEGRVATARARSSSSSNKGEEVQCSAFPTRRLRVGEVEGTPIDPVRRGGLGLEGVLSNDSLQYTGGQAQSLRFRNQR